MRRVVEGAYQADHRSTLDQRAHGGGAPGARVREDRCGSIEPANVLGNI